MLRICARSVVLLLILLATTAPGSAGAVTQQDLRNAWVPSLCGHPAGYLVDGALPEDDDPNNGGVSLVRSAVGPLRKSDEAWGVSVLSCSAGGVGWPDTLAFYRPDGTLADHAGLFGITKGGRESATWVRIAKRRVTVRVQGIAQSGDVLCCGTASALLTFRMKGDDATLVRKKVFTEKRTVRALLRAVAHHNTRKARKYGDRAAVRSLTYFRHRLGYRIRLQRCFGPLDDGFGYDDSVDRNCRLRMAKGSDRWFYDLGVRKVTWKQWRAVATVGD